MGISLPTIFPMRDQHKRQQLLHSGTHMGECLWDAIFERGTARDVATVVGGGRPRPPLGSADHHSGPEGPLPTTKKIKNIFKKNFFFMQNCIANGQKYTATIINIQINHYM